jgi:hypothetical protein
VAVFVDVVINGGSVVHFNSTQKCQVVRVHVNRTKVILGFRLQVVVSTVLKKPECAFIHGVGECCEIPIQVSDRDVSTLERDFNSLDVFPQGDDRFAIVELSKLIMSVSFLELLEMIRSMRGDNLQEILAATAAE